MYGLTGAEAFKLEIRLNGGSWIGVKDNTGKEWMTPARIMKAGEVIEFDVYGNGICPNSCRASQVH